MAKVKSLQSSEESKAKKADKELRFGNKTEKQKKFLKENPNVKTASEMDKKIKDYRTSNIQTRMSPGGYQELKTGGRAGLKDGSKGCKLAMKGKGKAYGKNS